MLALQRTATTLTAPIETELPKELVVSFKGVLCCSTAVINGLLRAKKQLLVSDGSLRLCGMSDVIREAYRMLHWVKSLRGWVYAATLVCLQAFVM